MACLLISQEPKEPLWCYDAQLTREPLLAPPNAAGIRMVVLQADSQSDFEESEMGNSSKSRHQQLFRLDPLLPFTSYLGTLGVAGVTGYFAACAAKPADGQLVLVCGAAGGIGSVITSVCSLMGSSVYGLVNDNAQRDFACTSGALQAFSCGTPQEVASILEQWSVSGKVDVVIDLVGGWLLDAVMPHLSKGGRILSVGSIEPFHQMVNIHEMLARRLIWEGFEIDQHRFQVDEAKRKLRRWVDDRDILLRETHIEGFERVPDAIRMMTEGVRGLRAGKLIVKVGLRHNESGLCRSKIDARNTSWLPPTEVL